MSAAGNERVGLEEFLEAISDLDAIGAGVAVANRPVDPATVANTIAAIVLIEYLSFIMVATFLTSTQYVVLLVILHGSLVRTASSSGSFKLSQHNSRTGRQRLIRRVNTP